MIQYEVRNATCVVRLDAPPLNAITLSLLEQLREAIARANRQAEVRGIVVTGRSDHFSAGADINLFRRIGSAEDAMQISRLFQEAFQELEDSPKPVVAAVAGRVMGSALELAMACHGRVCAEGSRFSMPEVNLGINPGAGGTQRLPRLVGLEAALRMLLRGEPIDAPEAAGLGLVDEVCRADELLRRAESLLHSATGPRPTSRRREKVGSGAANRAAFEQAERLLAGVRPEIVAPREILEAVRAGLGESFQAGLRREQEAFARCMGTPATQHKIYLFFATRETSKVPGLEHVQPAVVAKVAVVGMGSMGTGIVQALATRGLSVVVRDERDAALQQGMDRIRDSLQRRVTQGKLSSQLARSALDRVSTTTGWEGVEDVDLVIEAVYEDVQTKRQVIGQLEAICRPGAMIASNTSTISLDMLADGLQRPQRLIGMHFFNPAHRMPLVEIVRREGTAEEVVATAVDLAKRIGKTPVVVRNREGFLVNRLFVPYLKEAFWLLEDGADPPGVDAAMRDFGFAMGPLALIDMAGLDILAATDRVLREAFPRHGPLSQIATRLVERGHLGQKTGGGVYKYEHGSYAPGHSETAGEIIAEVRRAEGRKPRRLRPAELTERLVLRMVVEAFYVMQEGLALRHSDLDVAMVLGTGFPDFRGGVFRYAGQLGVDRVRTRLQTLRKRFGPRFAPCQLLREWKGG